MTARRGPGKAGGGPSRVEPGAVVKAAEVETREIGTSGLRRSGGLILEEFLPQLRGAAGRRVVREMCDNDPVVGAGLLAIDLLMRQVSWQVKPADESPLATEIRDFVDGAFTDMEDTWPDTLSSILSMLPYGWAVTEQTFKYRRGDRPGVDPVTGLSLPASRFNDGKLGWKGLPIRAQDSLHEWWYDERSSTLLGMIQRDPVDGTLHHLPAEAILHFRTSATKANPEGRSILRTAYRPWWFKRRIEEHEGVGIERDLAGLPVMWAAEHLFLDTATASEKQLLARLRDTVTKVRRNEAEGLLLPMAYDGEGRELYRFSLLNSGGSRQFDTSRIITRHDQRIVLSMMADFILLGHEGVGSLGMSIGNTKVDLFTAALEAWLSMLLSEFNDRAIPQLVRLNGWPVELAPKLTHGQVQSVNLTEVADFVNKVAGAGAPIFPDPTLLDHLLDLADLPHEAPGEAL